MSRASHKLHILKRLLQQCGAFFNSKSGFGMIETALVLPLFLGITFAVIDYGMMMSNRSSTAGIMSSLTRTIQDNPTIAAETLNKLVVNAGGGSVNFIAAGNCFCAKSFALQATAQEFVNGAGCADIACSSQWRNTGGVVPRYIGVRGQVTYKFITPVNKIFLGQDTKVIKFGQVVPVGITICPEGQALTSAGVCAASTITCGAGQFLNSSGTCSSAVPVCNSVGKALQFDGTNWRCVVTARSGDQYTVNDDGSCRYGNPYEANACRCSASYRALETAAFSNPFCLGGFYSDGVRVANCGVKTYQCIPN
jgi:Flp pilus assembly protein TadG